MKIITKKEIFLLTNYNYFVIIITVKSKEP